MYIKSATNGNLFCSVCVNTTGRDPKNHDMLEVCVMPLDRTFDRDKSYPLFTTVIKPIFDYPEGRDYYREEAYTLTHHVRKKGEYLNACTFGLGYSESADLFEIWFKKLNLKENKRILPLVYDWQHTSRFLRKWLGDNDMDDMFDYRHRDLISIAAAENDNAFYNHRDVPFPKLDFSYILSKLGMPGYSLQLPVGERSLMLGKAYMAYHLLRNTWR